MKDVAAPLVPLVPLVPLGHHTEGVAAVGRKVEGRQHHHQPGTACLGPDCPGAGGEVGEGGGVVGRGEDSEVVCRHLATPQVQTLPH